MKKIFVLLISFFEIAMGAFSQRVGINTPTPQETLDVNGNIFLSNKLGINITNPQFPLSFAPSVGDKISLYGNAGVHYGLGIQPYLMQIHTDGSASNIAFGYGSSNTFTETMRINGNGNVGIGTNNPLARLHVTDNSVLFSATGDRPAVQGLPPVSGAGRRMMWYADKAAFRAGYIDGTQWDKDSIGNYSTAMGYNTKALADYSMAMGISTTASERGSTAIGYATTSSGIWSTAMGYYTTASGTSSTAIGMGTVAKERGSLVIGTYNDISDDDNPPDGLNRIFQIGFGSSNYKRGNALTVLGSGNIGIGTTTPGFLLNFPNSLGDKVSFWGNSGAHYGIGIQSNQLQIHTDLPASNIVFGYGSSGSFTETMRIQGNGNVGIGTNSAAQKLVVVGNIFAYGYICATGPIGACSDIRYKKDFVPINHSLSSILALNGIYYYWKKDEFPDMQFNDKRQLGFSAQEVEKLFPEIVMTDANGYKSVDYGRLTPVLAEAIKEQQKQINEQQQQIDELKKLVEKLISK
jgi:hypothetical protein